MNAVLKLTFVLFGLLCVLLMAAVIFTAVKALDEAGLPLLGLGAAIAGFGLVYVVVWAIFQI